MAEFPAMPLFTDAYLSDTLHLSTLQHGAYCLLLMIAWRTADCALPDDDRVLARYSRLDFRTWMKNKSVVMQFWRLGDDQKWRQGRQLDERNRVMSLQSKNSAAGKASALKRKNRQPTSVVTKIQQKNSNHNHNHIEEDKSSSPPAPQDHPTRMMLTQLPDEWRDWAKRDMLWEDAVINDVWIGFKDFWTRKKGGAAMKTDWAATWRNWYRKENIKPTRGKNNETRRHSGFDKQDFDAGTSGFNKK